jgi:acyl dehydratase
VAHGEQAQHKRRLDRAIVGTRIGISTVTVSVDAIRAYALATNEENLSYLGEEDVIAPPLFQVVLAHQARPDEAMIAKGLDVLGDRLGLHAEQDMRFVAPIRPGETIVTETFVEAIEEHARGEMVRIASMSRTTEREMRCRSLMSILFIDDESRVSRPGRKPTAPLPGEPVATARMVVSEDQSLRYAEAAGDYTRTHVDEDVARSYGYPTYLVHGLCTMAFASKAVVDNLAAGDPSRLRRLRVRFVGPVFPGDVLTTSMWRTERSSAIALATTNDQGLRVIAGGLAEVLGL